MSAQPLSASIARDRMSAVVSSDRQMRVIQARAEDVTTAAERKQQVVSRAHEATRPTRQRKLAVDWGSANRIVGMDAKQLRDSARALCRDHDLAKSVLSVLVQNVVGSGIDVIAAPRKTGGNVDAVLGQELKAMWWDWWDRPEVTWQHDFGKVQQLLFSGYVRDGESFYQSLLGRVPFLDHGTPVPLSLEMLEADLIPLDFDDEARGILQGAERNAWGRIVAWHVYKRHPGDGGFWRTDTKRVSADQLRQFANIERIHQVRGLSLFAPVINRLRDLQDYEDSERIAAKVAASLCAQIIKGDASAYGADNPHLANEAAAAAERAYRAMTMVPGLIGDDLLPGERIDIIDSKRPNPNVATYINDQVRRVAGGTGASHSSVSRNYDGTYSAQRQELVETWGAYAMLGEQFTARVMRPIWADFVKAAMLANLIKAPRGWSFAEVSAAAFVRPAMPWIDPLKEALARGEAEDRQWQSPQQSILQMGNDPEEVRRLRADWAANGNDPTPNPAPADGSRARREGLIALALEESK